MGSRRARSPCTNPPEDTECVVTHLPERCNHAQRDSGESKQRDQRTEMRGGTEAHSHGGCNMHLSLWSNGQGQESSSDIICFLEKVFERNLEENLPRWKVSPLP